MLIALFGSGFIGKSLVKKLVNYDFVDELVVVDKNQEALDMVRKMITSDKITFERQDVSDIDIISKIISRMDLSIVALPPSLVVLNVIKVCADMGCNYLDLGLGDYPLLEILKNEDIFKNAGIAVFTGFGLAPGITNIMVKHLSHRLDSIEEVKIRDGSLVNPGDSMFTFTYSPSIFLSDFTIKPLVYRDGEFKRVQPLSEEEDYEFPSPVGNLKVYLIDHEEVFSLPKYLGKEMKHLDYKLALTDETYQVIKTLLRLGLLRDDYIEINGIKISPKSVLLELIFKSVNQRVLDGYEMLVVDIKGYRGGNKFRLKSYIYMTHKEAFEKYNENATSYLTSLLPLTIVEMLHKGEIEQTGLILPEMLNCEIMIQKLISKGLPYFEKEEPGLQ
jgi:saccharopine dehydrogenase (NAD+, L-lysine-forming)